MNSIKVLIVDDSALVREVLSSILNAAKGIEVVGVAADPLIARDKIKALSPDVLTLDVEMPRMDGIKFLGNLMRLRPMPVVMVSTLTEKGADVTLRALELGAVDFLAKPKSDLRNAMGEYAEELVSKVRVAASAKVRPHVSIDSIKAAAVKHNADAVLLPKASSGNFRTTDRIIAIGASTGGTEAIKEVMVALPADSPGIVITQHMPPAFTKSFAERLNGLTALNVSEAVDGAQVIPGHAYVAPGDKHLMLTRNGAQYVCKLSDGPAVNRHKPSVDVLFRSVAQNAGKNAVGVLLTGMGSDGAEGMLEMQQAGVSTAAQNEQTCVVYGMPRAAVELGAADDVLPLNSIAEWLINRSSK